MKKIYSGSILFIIFTLLMGCSSSTETPNRETNKRITVRKPAKFKTVERKEREYIVSSNIRLVDKLDFDFNSQGKLINKGKLSTVKYDKQGFPVETIIYGDSSRIQNKYTYKYDKNGRRIESIRYDKSGSPDKKYTYEYDSFGNKIKSTKYNMLGNVEEYYEYKYDDQGNLLEERWVNPDGETEYEITYYYDNIGRKAEARTHDEESGSTYKYEFKYDDSGGIVEEIKYDEGKKVGVIQYVYKYY